MQLGLKYLLNVVCVDTLTCCRHILNMMNVTRMTIIAYMLVPFAQLFELESRILQKEFDMEYPLEGLNSSTTSLLTLSSPVVYYRHVSNTT